MLKGIFAAAAIAVGLLSLPAAANAATPAIAAAAVNLRAGPGTVYPVITTIPAGARVTTFGCLPSYAWCDVSIGINRGWVASSYLHVYYNGTTVVVAAPVAPRVGIVVVQFNQSYWTRYYASYPWYRNWNYYAHPPYAVAPRIDSHSRSIGCNGGSCTGTRSTTGIYGGSTNQTRTCADGTCSSTRTTTGAAGNSASRARTCSAADRSCSSTRTGPRGGTVSGSRSFHR